MNNRINGSVLYQWLLVVIISLISVAAVAGDYTDRADVNSFIEEMVNEYQFSRAQLHAWFATAKKKQTIIDAISRPAEKTLTWKQYRKIFLTQSRITKGVEFWRKNMAILTRVEKEFGVPAHIIVAIIGVETLYGKHKGSYRVIDALSTLAFDYPPRSAFFRKELKQFLLLVREQKQDHLSLYGSYAGAMGYGQFIPSSYRAYAIDYSDDQLVDIWDNIADAIASVANYLKQHGWQMDQAVAMRARINDGHNKTLLNDSLKPRHTVQQLIEQGYTAVDHLPQQAANIMRLEGEYGAEFWLGLHNFYVITRYNHSRLYAMAVWQLSQAIVKAKEKS